MKKKQNIPTKKLKKLSEAEKKYKDILKRIAPFLPEKTHVARKQYSEWNTDTASLMNIQKQDINDSGR